MPKIVLTMDLGDIVPRSALEVAMPTFEMQLKKMMEEQFSKAGMKPKNVTLHITE